MLGKSIPENRLNPFNFIKRMVRESSDKAAFAINPFKGTDPILCLHNPKYLKEYIINENNYTKKLAVYEDSLLTAGLFYAEGKESVRLRAIFVDIFSVEKLGVFSNELFECFRTIMLEFKEKALKNQDKTVKNVNLKLVLEDMMDKSINLLVFGN